MTEERKRLFRKPKVIKVRHDPEEVHENSLQRLSVYIQLKRPGAKVSNTNGHFACENTIIIFDSSHRANAKDALINGKEPWRQVLDALEGLKGSDATTDVNSISSSLLAMGALKLTLEAVASKWSVYILHMHLYIASLEEQIYSQPADDSRATGIWSVSKQLLQAERLLKFHILLLENIQDDFVGLTIPDALAPDWLRQNIIEFTRLSSEVEETLKKPIAHMVDLVSLFSPIFRFSWG